MARTRRVGLTPRATRISALSLLPSHDFTAVTDHSEFLGEIALCLDEASPAYDTLSCRNFRTSTEFEEFVGADIAFAGWGAGLALGTGRPVFCQPGRGRAR